MKLYQSAAVGLILLSVLFFASDCNKSSSSQMATGVPVLTTTAINTITQTTAMGGGSVSADGGATISGRGICWSTTVNPTTSDIKTMDGSGIGTFTSSLTGLVAGTTYHVRAYATNSNGTGYGNDISFATLTNGGSTASVSIVSMTIGFSPKTLSVTKGTIITWTNNDAISHTVTSNDGTSFSSGNIVPGGTFSYTANTSGTFAYYCAYHSGMTGTLTVTP